MYINLLRKIKPLLIRLLIYLETKSKITARKKPKEYQIHPLIFYILIFLLLYLLLLPIVGLNLLKLVVLFFTLLFLSLLFIFYLYITFKPIMADNNCVSLIGFLLFVYLSIFLVAKMYIDIGPYFFPLCSLSMFVVLLLNDEKLAIDITLVATLLISIIYNSISGFLFHLISSIVSSYLTIKCVTRRDILFTGLKITIFNTIFAFFCEYLFYQTSTQPLFEGCMNGLISIFLVLAFLSPLETLFSRLTNLTLIELADFNQPLLKRIMHEAPGTYHHSLIVASLAEQSARIVNANPLFLRVCSYYHDIGKLIKPEYFIENQIGIENPHKVLPTTMSTLIIISHVKEGVKLAYEQKLNQKIINVIQEHHGTSYPYTLSIEKMTDEYRYPGPKPSTKEAAILMLADSCEAAVRNLTSHTPQAIRSSIENVVKMRLEDGQFNEAPLTLLDIYKIADSITATLISVYHTRETQKFNNAEHIHKK